MQPFVTGFGKVNVDLIFQAIPRLPAPGEEVFTDRFSLCLGGGIPATLLNLGRLGVCTKIVTEIGTDMFSLFALDEFRKAGVTPVNLYGGDDIPVNLTSVILTPGERTFVSYGKQTLLDNGEAQLYEEMRGAKIAGMQTDYPELYSRLKSDGTILVLDTGFIEDMTCEKFDKYLRLADYYTPNRAEALKMTGCTDVRKAAVRLSDYFENVIIKLDRDGCLIYNSNGFTLVRSIEEFTHCDSTGAGDAFLAGFIYGLYNERPIEQCVLYGCLTGGKCITAVGCTTASLNERELLALAEKYEGNITTEF